VTLVPAQTESAEAVIPDGAVEKVFSFNALLTHAVILHVPSARTKYVVEVVGVTVRLVPEPIDVPPQFPLYHLQDALLPKVPP